MGLKDRIAAKYADRDWTAELTAALDDGDVLLAWTTGMAAAYQRTSHGLTLSARTQSLVVSGLQNSLAKANHIGGDKGSIAQSLPLANAENSGTLVLSVYGLSVWHFDPAGGTPTCTLRIARADLSSITRSAARRRGYAQARVLFRDGSFFDFFVAEGQGTESFWNAAALVRPSV